MPLIEALVGPHAAAAPSTRSRSNASCNLNYWKQHTTPHTPLEATSHQAEDASFFIFIRNQQFAKTKTKSKLPLQTFHHIRELPHVAQPLPPLHTAHERRDSFLEHPRERWALRVQHPEVR